MPLFFSLFFSPFRFFRFSGVLFFQCRPLAAAGVRLARQSPYGDDKGTQTGGLVVAAGDDILCKIYRCVGVLITLFWLLLLCAV